MCLEGSCMCPNGYRPVSDNSKCARVGGKCNYFVHFHILIFFTVFVCAGVLSL